jgi:hypothetical protein
MIEETGIEFTTVAEPLRGEIGVLKAGDMNGDIKL